MDETLDLCAPPAPRESKRLRALAENLRSANVMIGTSSWKYAGWLDQIYSPERYATRGKFAKTRFEDTCLEEYSEVFSTVCADAGFYRFPLPTQIAKWASQTSPGFKMSWKVTDEITARRFANLPRHGSRAGEVNKNFLNARLFIDEFLGPLSEHGEKVGALIFEFGHRVKKSALQKQLAEVEAKLSGLSEVSTPDSSSRGGGDGGYSASMDVPKIDENSTPEERAYHDYVSSGMKGGRLINPGKARFLQRQADRSRKSANNWNARGIGGPATQSGQGGEGAADKLRLKMFPDFSKENAAAIKKAAEDRKNHDEGQSRPGPVGPDERRGPKITSRSDQRRQGRRRQFHVVHGCRR